MWTAADQGMRSLLTPPNCCHAAPPASLQSLLALNSVTGWLSTVPVSLLPPPVNDLKNGRRCRRFGLEMGGPTGGCRSHPPRRLVPLVLPLTVNVHLTCTVAFTGAGHCPPAGAGAAGLASSGTLATSTPPHPQMTNRR